jgi:hypothetical protein
MIEFASLSGAWLTPLLLVLTLRTMRYFAFKVLNRFEIFALTHSGTKVGRMFRIRFSFYGIE